MLLRYRSGPGHGTACFKKQHNKKVDGKATVVMGEFSLVFGFWFGFYDTPSVFGYAVASEILVTRQRKCFYAIAGTAYWTETETGDNASALSPGLSRGRLCFFPLFIPLDRQTALQARLVAPSSSDGPFLRVGTALALN